MILTFFEKILLGHLIGDYLLQNNWMAKNKKSRALPCLIHCAIYTACVAQLTSWNLYWVLAIFVSHYIIDRSSIVEYWLQAHGGRSVKKFLATAWEGAPDTNVIPYLALQGGVTAFVVIVVDNIFHLILMLLAADWLIKLGLLATP